MTRSPLIGTPAERRSKPLHRTMPCWSRKIVDGKVQYSLLVPHRLGGGIQTIEIFGPETPRLDIARLLRERRRMLWGRSKDGENSEDDAPKKPCARKAVAAAPIHAAVEAPSAAIEATQSPLDDRPPWDEEAENARAFAADADAALEAAIRGKLDSSLQLQMTGDPADPEPAGQDLPDSVTALVIKEVLSPEPTAPESATSSSAPIAYPDGQLGFAF